MAEKIPVYKVDKDVPTPEPLPPKTATVPIDQLKVDESIRFPASERSKVQTMASRLKRDKKKQFTIRKEDDVSCRVWRTK